MIQVSDPLVRLDGKPMGDIGWKQTRAISWESQIACWLLHGEPLIDRGRAIYPPSLFLPGVLVAMFLPQLSEDM